MEEKGDLECDSLSQSENLLKKDGETGVTSSSQCIVASQRPVKKQTRQWAAWTHEEEECFFHALRQVGKNFEKITSRVQSKNKDQVRHYYYRLVRRMNKLLGPSVCLDAKNSKETNAAMLRWWTLLEKHSCKASKLHLKPRRFKIFIEALEHQLTKDRKKYIKKRPSQGENCSSASPVTVSLLNKASANDTRTVKLVVSDNSNSKKASSGRGSSLKRNVNTGTNRSSGKGDLSTVKTVKQRKRTGNSTSAAYKKWEKAAIAGVSLVADAAEQLERTSINKKVSPDRRSLGETFPLTVFPAVPASSQTQVADTSLQQPFAKLKLQLFPIDEGTRRALEKDEHNPYLELTLSARKKISSVLEHLNRKWGKSSIASGELILFQYSVQRDNLVRYQRWTQDTVDSAADVYAVVGSPPIFRLRYGWFSTAELGSVISTPPSHIQEEHLHGKEQKMDGTVMLPLQDCHNSAQSMKSSKDQQTSVTENTDLIPCYTDLPEDIIEYIGLDHENNISDAVHAVNSLWPRKKVGDGIIQSRCDNVDYLRTSNSTTFSAGDWADSLTNISIGALLTEASQAMGTNDIDPPVTGSSQFLQQIPFSCDSFDAAIAAHISGHQDRQVDLASGPVSHASSIWDDEETRDAFSFQKISRPSTESSLGTLKQTINTSSMVIRDSVQGPPEVRTTCDGLICEGDPTDNYNTETERPDDYIKDVGGITDMYWPDSLGPLDLDMPSRYHDQDLMFGESISLSGLNRLIASSLDAFQNCSFFDLDKKEPPSTGEGRSSAPLLDCKIGGEV